MSLELSGTTGLKGVAGSVAAPSIVGDDTNTGISFPAADTIKFSTGGVERMSITNSGISGITQGKILVKKDEDVEMLISRIHKIEHYLLPKIISDLCNENIYLDCETNKVTYNHELDKEITSIYFDNF